MKIKIKDVVLISDTHNDHSKLELPDADLCIHAGDACIKGNYTEVRNFLQWYVKQPFKYKVYVPGNHDARMYTHYELQSLAKEYGIYILHDDLLELGDLKLYGNSKTFPSLDRVQKVKWSREDAWVNIPEDVDILITHMPSHGIMDLAARQYNIGCPELKKVVANKKPKIHVFGHIHESAGKVEVIDGVKRMCVSVKDRDYTLINYSGYYYNMENLIGRKL